MRLSKANLIHAGRYRWKHRTRLSENNGGVEGSFYHAAFQTALYTVWIRSGGCKQVAAIGGKVKKRLFSGGVEVLPNGTAAGLPAFF
ncbi:hypothetical protein E4T85_21825 [Bacillus stratosphericus]|nr:hypothetical protein E4T85_21825 [Bacillus stratosphericus]